MKSMPNSAATPSTRKQRKLPSDMERNHSNGTSITRTITISAVDENDFTAQANAEFEPLVRDLSLATAEAFQRQGVRMRNDENMRR